MQNRDRLHSAYLLHRRPYSNTSLLLECFTEEHGRFPVLAKGVMAPKRPTGHGLQPFRALLIRVAGRGEMKTLTHGEATRCANPLQGRGLYCGFYLNELLMRLLGRNDPHPDLFACYARTLSRLALGEGEPEPVLRAFEVDLLRELGYGPVFDHLPGGGVTEPGGWYHYRLEEGVVPAAPGEKGAVGGETLLALAGKRAFGEQERLQARGVMRQILTHYLGDRPLKSRELFQAGYRLGGERA